MEIYCEVDLKPLIKEGEKAGKALERAFVEMWELANWTFERLIDLTPKSGRSKEGDSVADSWERKWLKVVMFRELAWSVLSENEIVGHLEYGTRDHWIFPRIAKVLHWIDPDTGEDAFSAGHIVSGIKPVGMIRQTEKELDSNLKSIKARAKLRIEN